MSTKTVITLSHIICDSFTPNNVIHHFCLCVKSNKTESEKREREYRKRVRRTFTCDKNYSFDGKVDGLNHIPIFCTKEGWDIWDTFNNKYVNIFPKCMKINITTDQCQSNSDCGSGGKCDVVENTCLRPCAPPSNSSIIVEIQKCCEATNAPKNCIQAICGKSVSNKVDVDPGLFESCFEYIEKLKHCHSLINDTSIPKDSCAPGFECKSDGYCYRVKSCTQDTVKLLPGQRFDIKRRKDISMFNALLVTL